MARDQVNARITGRLWNSRLPAQDFSKLSDREQIALLKMYKLYVGTTTEISNRRMTCNAFFLSLHTAGVAGIGGGIMHFAPQHAKWTALVVLMASFMGMYLCLVWRKLLK